MRISRELRNAGEVMSTQLAREVYPNSASKNSEVPKKPDLEPTTSAEVTLYDYEAAVSQPDFEKYRAIEKKKNGQGAFPSNIPQRKKDWNTRGRGSIGVRKTPPGKIQALQGGKSNKEQTLPIATRKSKPCPSVSEEAEVDDSDEEDEKFAEGDSETVDSETSPSVQKRAFGKNVSDEVGKSETDSSPSSPSEKEVENRRSQQSKGNTKSSFPRKSDTLNTVSFFEYTRNSRIPRARFRKQIVTCQAAQVFPIEESSVKSKSKISILERHSSTQNEHGDSHQSEQAMTSIEPQDEVEDLPKEGKPSVINISRISLNEERVSGVEADEEPEADNGVSSRDESPAVIDTVGDPSTVVGVGNIKLDCSCRSCDDRRKSTNLEMNVRDVLDPWSDSHSSPEMKNGAIGWLKTLKNNAYIDSSSEEMDLSSDYSSDNVIPMKRRSRSDVLSPIAPFVKSTATNPKSSKIKNHCRTKFSFFNTLFDIVFWPFLFLKTNR